MSVKAPNLLPLKDQKHYQTYQLVKKVNRVLLGQVLILALIVVAVWGYQVALNDRLAELRADVQALEQVQEITDAGESLAAIKQFNNRIIAASNVLQKKHYVSGLMRELQILAPNGLTLDLVEINTGSAEVHLAGRAFTRDQLVLFQRRLEESSVFGIKDAPLSNLTATMNANFVFTLSYQTSNVTKY